MASFVESQNLNGCKVNALYDEGRSPFLIVQIEPSAGSTSDSSILFYGHMDKQPFGPGWKHDPTDPVIENGKLYGRGSSDDCYALYAALLSIKACQAKGLSHPRIVITIEGSEEGGNTEDLIYYLQTYKHLIGEPNTVICLDTSAFLEDTLAISSSLRGGCNFDLSVKVGEDNMHSGYSGIVPDPYIIAISLLSRIVDFKTQEVVKDFEVEIPQYRIEEAKFVASRIPLLSAMLPKNEGLLSRAHEQPKEDENFHLLLNQTWKPSLTVVGQNGIPENLGDSSNSIKSQVTLRCSLRLPPTYDVKVASQKLQAILQADPPYNAIVKVEPRSSGQGFDAPPLRSNLQDALFEANKQVFSGNLPLFVGCGGGIPFMDFLSKQYPGANYILTGVGFPDSNAHAANENIDLEFCRKLITTLALTLSKL
ncbi:hypothetical protein FGO68_gene7249 [Halteria grandinella]|uniref:Peptidase M20 dimerisation domain-containing protein n=1 Tax=Halteria grandinella TaxID=5974 RepID=A0A8J8NPH4_HALGN|nr:hypothetical protein FGO68_gene7249 [Halteria grandinella]